MKDYTLELRGMDGRLIQTSLAGGEFTAVPFGEYVLVALSDCCRAQRDLIVNVPAIWVRIGIPLRFGDSVRPGGDLTVKGVIRGTARASGEKWVRVRGVFLDFSREMEIGSSGRFSIEGLDMGTYVVEVFVASKLLHSQPIEIDARTPVADLAIDLGKSSSQ